MGGNLITKAQWSSTLYENEANEIASLPPQRLLQWEETQWNMTVLCFTQGVWMKFEDYMQLYYSKFSMTIHVQGLILKNKGKPKNRI